MARRKWQLLLSVPLAVAGVILHAMGQELISDILCILAWGIAGYDVVLNALSNLKGRLLMGEHFLMSVATIGALLLGEFPEAAMVMVLYQIGEFFQALAVGRSRESIAALMDIAAPVAYRLEAGERVEIDPDEIVQGDLLEIRAGEKIPADSVVVKGASAIDSSALTGESVPVEVCEGDTVLSGSINGDGHLVVRALKSAEDSTAMRILHLLEGASEHQAKSEALVTRFSKVYTPIVVFSAILLMIIPPLTFSDAPVSEWIMRGLTFLVVSCPCAFVISVPMAFFSGIGVSSRVGALVKGGDVLENLSKVETIGVDKTGTLTEGKFEVLHLHVEEDVEKSELISLADAMEAGSSHPIAEAIHRYAQGVESAPCEVSNIEVVRGRGMRAQWRGEDYVLGNFTYMDEVGLSAEAVADGCDGGLVATMVHMAKITPNLQYLGHFVIRDRVKPEAREAVASLHARGIQKVAMLTGDAAAIAEEVGAEVGVDEVHSRLLPEDKLQWVLDRKAEASGTVAFIGDGLNDAPVLTAADVGIAMGGIGSDASIAAADVVLMADDLSSVTQVLDVARKTTRIARQNIIGSLGVKFVFLGLSAVGLANMWMAVFADVGVTLLAVGNCFRLFQGLQKKKSSGKNPVKQSAS